MTHIFISYSKKDRDYARKLADYLEHQGFEVWIDDRIDFGEEWERVIFKAIDLCLAFIVVMTPNSFQSKWVLKEMQYAERRNKPEFPILLDGEEFPRYGPIQYFNATGGKLPNSQFVDRLMKHCPRKVDYNGAYPLSAIIGQELMKTALILSIIDMRIGGVLLIGERGTAKSFAARSLPSLLPDIDVFSESRFNDDPSQPETWSDEIRAQIIDGKTLHVVRRKMPFVELPVSATEDRIVGDLDIEAAIQKGERHFYPGLLAKANRGIIHVDQINLLQNDAVNVLLDSSAMGVNVVERDGVSFSHPSRYILYGTMNPEEGYLRPQILDRFGLVVYVEGLSNVEDRVEILQRHMEYVINPIGFRIKYELQELELAAHIRLAREFLDEVTYSEHDLHVITTITNRLNVPGHRVDISILRTACANAAFNGRHKVDGEDILLAGKLSVPHRLKRGRFADSLNAAGVENRIKEILKELSVEAF